MNEKIDETDELTAAARILIDVVEGIASETERATAAAALSLLCDRIVELSRFLENLTGIEPLE